MRRIKTIEGISLGYFIYFLITLFFVPNLFVNEKSKLYEALETVMPGQNTWEVISAVLIVIYVISLFIYHYIAEMIVNALGGAFFILIAITYFFTFPNIGGGMFLLVSVYCFRQVYKASNRHETEKIAKVKHKLSEVEDYDYKKYTDQ